MILRPPRSTLFPTRRSSDLVASFLALGVILAAVLFGFNLGLVFSGLMVALFAGYVIYDTSNIIQDRKSTRLNSSHPSISYAVFCLKKKKTSTTFMYCIKSKL